MMKVIWSEGALLDLERIRDYIALDNPAYANVFVERLLKTTRHLPQFPQSGRLMPEAKALNIREVLYQGYRIVYRLSPDLIEVVMATHGSRNLGDTENTLWDSN